MSSRKIQKTAREEATDAAKRKYPNNNHGNNNYRDSNKWIP